jgi:hypothetical protein
MFRYRLSPMRLCNVIVRHTRWPTVGGLGLQYHMHGAVRFDMRRDFYDDFRTCKIVGIDLREVVSRRQAQKRFVLLALLSCDT